MTLGPPAASDPPLVADPPRMLETRPMPPPQQYYLCPRCGQSTPEPGLCAACRAAEMEPYRAAPSYSSGGC